jgi:hypothetical protein
MLLDAKKYSLSFYSIITMVCSACGLGQFHSLQQLHSPCDEPFWCVVQVLSTMATQPLEDVAKAVKDGPLQLFQLYVIKDRKFCKSLIQRKDMHKSQSVASKAVIELILMAGCSVCCKSSCTLLCLPSLALLHESSLVAMQLTRA